MPLPEGSAPPGCPPGLEYLTQIDQILVHQQIEIFECKKIHLRTNPTYMYKFIHLASNVLAHMKVNGEACTIYKNSPYFVTQEFIPVFSYSRANVDALK